jgi:hypothetical protein
VEVELGELVLHVVELDPTEQSQLFGAPERMKLQHRLEPHGLPLAAPGQPDPGPEHVSPFTTI